MHAPDAGYGLWLLAAINAAFFIFFAWSFYKPLTRWDWRGFGMFSAFVVALFAEMYGFPLTLYVLGGWLSANYPQVNWLSHDAGHLLEMWFGWRANPHFGPFHIASFVLIGGGFWLLSAAWPVLYWAQRAGRLAREGVYTRMRHPQYVAFVLVLTGFLLQWPTLLTLASYPVLVWAYARLARREEKDCLSRFGDDYVRYMQEVPAFIPRRRLGPGATQERSNEARPLHRRWSRGRLDSRAARLGEDHRRVEQPMSPFPVLMPRHCRSPQEQP